MDSLFTSRTVCVRLRLILRLPPLLLLRLLDRSLLLLLLLRLFLRLLLDLGDLDLDLR